MSSSSFSSEWWVRVLASPGFSHIPEYIFDSIDAQTLAAVELVSKVDIIDCSVMRSLV